MTLAEIEADPVAVISTIRAGEPFLQWGGFFNLPFERKRLGEEEADARLIRFRAEMTNPWCIRQMLDAARFIDQSPKTKGINHRRSTYGWKHVVERHNKLHRPEGDYYVGEGMFIAAAAALGLTIWRDRGICRVNLSQKAADQKRWQAMAEADG